LPRCAIAAGLHRWQYALALVGETVRAPETTVTHANTVPACHCQADDLTDSKTHSLADTNSSGRSASPLLSRSRLRVQSFRWSSCLQWPHRLRHLQQAHCLTGTMRVKCGINDLKASRYCHSVSGFAELAASKYQTGQCHALLIGSILFTSSSSSCLIVPAPRGGGRHSRPYPSDPHPYATHPLEQSDRAFD
jgi:hypothetical protein